eukprot:5480217-Pleurochrysis_carterae.AAC.1
MSDLSSQQVERNRPSKRRTPTARVIATVNSHDTSWRSRLQTPGAHATYCPIRCYEGVGGDGMAPLTHCPSKCSYYSKLS